MSFFSFGLSTYGHATLDDHRAFKPSEGTRLHPRQLASTGNRSLSSIPVSECLEDEEISKEQLDFLRGQWQKNKSLPGKFITDCFLSHASKADEVKQNNHKRVQLISEQLEDRGVSVWIDDKEMFPNGNLRDGMARGFYHSHCFAIFTTRAYEANLVKKIIPIIMDKSMLNADDWEKGRLKAELGGRLFIDMTDDEETNHSNYHVNCDRIVHEIRRFKGEMYTINNLIELFFMLILIGIRKL